MNNIFMQSNLGDYHDYDVVCCFSAYFPYLIGSRV